jgi:hypothetical protein
MECTLNIVAKAVNMCIRKVRKRIRGVVFALADSGAENSMLHSNNPSGLQIRLSSGNTSGTLVKAIMKVFKQIPEGQQYNGPSDEEVLAAYLHCVLAMNESTDVLRTRIKRVSDIIELSYVIGITLFSILSKNSRTYLYGNRRCPS